MICALSIRQNNNSSKNSRNRKIGYVRIFHPVSPGVWRGKHLALEMTRKILGIIVLEIHTFLTKYIQSSHRPCMKSSGLPTSVSCPILRKANDEDCVPLYRSERHVHLFCKFRMTFT